MTEDRNAAERMRRYRGRQRGEDIPMRRPGPPPDPTRVTVIVLPLADDAEYERLTAGTCAYCCSTCCGSARFVVGRYRVCSRHITRALYNWRLPPAELAAVIREDARKKYAAGTVRPE